MKILDQGPVSLRAVAVVQALDYPGAHLVDEEGAFVCALPRDLMEYLIDQGLIEFQPDN